MQKNSLLISVCIKFYMVSTLPLAIPEYSSSVECKKVGAQTIIKVSCHQYWWLVGGCDLEIGHFQKWLFCTACESVSVTLCLFGMFSLHYFYTSVCFSSFGGCIRDVAINFQELGLQTSSPSNLGNDPPAASVGCPREDNCYPSPCDNGAQCKAEWDGYTCQCSADFTGQTCGQGKDCNLDLLLVACSRCILPLPLLLPGTSYPSLQGLLARV